MKNFVYAIIFIIIGFIFNLLLFFFNDSYRETIKNLKHKDIKENIKISDDYNIDKQNVEKNSLDNSKNNDLSKNDIQNLEQIREEEIDKQLEETKLKQQIKEKKIDDSSWKNLEKTIGFKKEAKANIDFVKWAFKKYKLKKVKKDDELFYITTEYPNNFLQYNGENIVLYFFENTDYDKNLEIFDALSYIGSFSLNKTNSFGEKSFYINKIKADSLVRLVIKYKNITFGLMFDKKYYNDIKDILKRKIR